MKSRARAVCLCWAHLVCPALLVLHQGTGYGITRYVPDHFATIQGALDASVSSDTVQVRRGVYSEALRFPAADVVLVSDFVFSSDSTDLFETVIDASAFADSDTAAVVSFFRHNTRAAILAGFTLRGGMGTMSARGYRAGGAVYVTYSSPTIRSNFMTANGGSVPGVFSETASPVVSHNLMWGNVSGEPFSRLACFFGSLGEDTVHFVWNEIRQNHGVTEHEGNAIGGVVFNYARAEVKFNWFHDLVYPCIATVQMLYSPGQFCGNTFERIEQTSADYSQLIHVDQMVSLFQDNVFRDCRGLSRSVFGQERWNLSQPIEISRNLFQNLDGVDSVNGTGIFIFTPAVCMYDNAFINCWGGRSGMIHLSVLRPGACDVIMTRNLFRLNRVWPRQGHSGIHIILWPCTECVVNNNWFEGNAGTVAMQSDSSYAWDVSGNYWGDSTGPYHPIENPNGRGDTVGIGCHVSPWLTEPPDLEAAPRPSSQAAANSWTLEPIYPNPFNAVIHVRLNAAQTIPLEVAIYDLLGRRVRDFWRGVVPASSGVDLQWDGSNEHGPLPSGVYLISCWERSARGVVKTQKAVMIR